MDREVKFIVSVTVMEDYPKSDEEVLDDMVLALQDAEIMAYVKPMENEQTIYVVWRIEEEASFLGVAKNQNAAKKIMNSDMNEQNSSDRDKIFTRKDYEIFTANLEE